MGIAALMKVFRDAAPPGVSCTAIRMRYVPPNESQQLEIDVIADGTAFTMTLDPVPAGENLAKKVETFARDLKQEG